MSHAQIPSADVLRRRMTVLDAAASTSDASCLLLRQGIYSFATVVCSLNPQEFNTAMRHADGRALWPPSPPLPEQASRAFRDPVV